MRVLIIGSLSGELAIAGRMAIARGARLEQSDTVDAALDRLRRDARVDLVLCDIFQDIAALVRSLASERIAVAVVACGVAPPEAMVLRAIQDGAREFLPLPPDADLIAAILQAAAGETHHVVVQDPVMLATLRRVQQVACADASVLICGESGTGKEVLARLIHRSSRRNASPFIALNCAAIPENLLESELFGHEKGAFSGAVARRIGKFEAADGGTLLLDEISEMDVRLQAKLLRALQEREIDRVGGSAPVRINVRILATTNRDLPIEVAAGRFREDLFFRLNVISLKVPSLRERPGDIIALAEHFAQHYAEVNGVPSRPLSLAAQQKLRAHGWRGNVRELDNTIHRAVLLAEGAEIDGDAIELTSTGPLTARAQSAGASPHFVGRTMDAMERELILQTLNHTVGNRTHAAVILGISIRALRNKLRDYVAQGEPVPPPPGGIALAYPLKCGSQALDSVLRRFGLGDIFPAHLLPPWLRQFRPGSDIALAMGVVALLSILIIPLPTFLLDLGLALSVTAAVLVLMVSLFLRRPLDFTSFPTLLLLTTLLRLSLNVATTRLILSHGNEGTAAAGHVVAAFGGFLMGGDVVIGLILFAILLVVNFMVITKGSGRIAEVAARFSLDSMPGKQMAIDADLSSGMCDEKTARLRRSELEQESGFYGAMDGAAKFVRGDAIAGLLITSINIVGGLAIGLIRHGMAFSDAASTYTTLTVGDGLVSQIPALLVSTAAGIVVTKGGIEGTADVALVRQLGGNPKPLALAGGAAAILALMPGLPALPFLALAGMAGGAAYLRHKHPPRQEDVVSVATPANAETPIADSLKIDTIRLELGYGLLSLAGGDAPRLTEQIKGLRRSIAAEMGFVLPPVRIQDNMQLAAETYILRIKEIEGGRGQLRPTQLLAMNPAGGLPELDGEQTQEPAFGLPARWVAPSLREEALFRGYTVVDPPSVLTTHLTEIVRENMAELLSYAETQKLLDELPREQSKLVADLIPGIIPLGGVQRVLQALLAERISIRDLSTILEGIHEACGGITRAVPTIVAHVRARLARQISDSHVGQRGYLPLIALSPEWEGAFAESLIGPQDERQLAMAPSQLQDFIKKLRAAFDAASAAGDTPVLLTSGGIRLHVRSIVERVRPSTAVLAQAEIHPRARIRTVGTI